MSLWPAPPLPKRRVEDKINDRIHDAGHDVENLIMATPTGPKREKLTEANIHLMAAQSAIREDAKL